MKWFLEKIGPEGLNQMLSGFEDKTANAICTFGFTTGPDCEVHLFQGIVPGEIVQPRGPRDFGWDCCFQPKGYEETYAQLRKEVKNDISHRSVALNKLKMFLKSTNIE